MTTSYIHYTLLTFLKVWITKEEVIATLGRCCLTSIWLENIIHIATNFIHFIEDGVHALLEEPVSWDIFTDVKVSF